MKNKMKEVHREILPGVSITLTGEDIQEQDAVLAEVLIELAAEAGGTLRVSMDDYAMLDKILQRLQQKGIDFSQGQNVKDLNLH
jgi:hypothetical protein